MTRTEILLYFREKKRTSYDDVKANVKKYREWLKLSPQEKLDNPI